MSSAISPAADVREALQSALVQVAERNCFAFAEAVDDAAFGQLAGATTSWVCAEVPYRGAFHGVLRVAMPTALARSLCSRFMGTFDDTAPGDAELLDFTGEVANMVVGAWLSRAHTSSLFDLSPPVVAVMPEGWQPRPLAGDAPALVAVDDAAVAAWATGTA